MIPVRAPTEPVEPIRKAPPHLDVHAHLEAIRRDFADRRIAPTPLNVLARALDVGLPEHVAVAVAELVEVPT